MFFDPDSHRQKKKSQIFPVLFGFTILQASRGYKQRCECVCITFIDASGSVEFLKTLLNLFICK
jgi:hypothetical protein